MKPIFRLVSFSVLTFLIANFSDAADSFTESIKSGDRLRSQKQFGAALAELEAAFAQATNDTDRGIALGKQAEIHSYDLTDHDAARQTAGRVLALSDAGPVARVTGLKVLARCKIEADKDYNSAIATLTSAAALKDVDWAQPTILLMLGDCYRSTGKHEQAIKTYGRVPRLPDVQKSVAAIAYLNAGMVYQYDLRRLDRARLHYDKAVDLNPGLRDQVGSHLDGRTRNANGPPLILAHYMPWYTAKPPSDRWGWHWTMNHFDPEMQSDGKRQIASKYYPLIGPYDSGDPHVLEYHLLLMKLSGIDGVIVDWYGLTDFRDYAILHRNTTRLLQQCERLKMKFVICYEDQTIPALVEANRITTADRVPHAAKEFEWLGESWFKSPSYVKLDGKPVLLSFGHAGLTNDEWSQCLSRLEPPVSYFSQDIRRNGAIGGFGWPSPKAGMQQVDRFLTESSNWSAAIPAAFPRFDDIYREAKVNEGYPQLPDNNGRTLQSTLDKALKSKAPIIQIATWNDWGEGTQIEPSVEFGYRDLEFLQKALKKDIDPGTAHDLNTFPYQILRLRRLNDVDQETIDGIVQCVCSGKWEAARTKLEAVRQKSESMTASESDTTAGSIRHDQ